MKKRLIIWGAATKWLHKLISEISLEYDIVGIIDQDKWVFDLKFLHIRIYRPREVLNVDFDYLLIPWWSSVKEVCTFILNTNSDLINKCVIFKDDCKLIEPIDFEKTGLWDSPVDSANRFKVKSNLIAHACGGWVNNEQIRYTNSYEALTNTLNNGFETIEIDVMFYCKHIICAHCIEDILSNKRLGLKTQTIEDIIDALVIHKNLSFLVDVKYSNNEEYGYILDCIDNLLKQHNHSVKKRLIIEVYDKETIIIAQKKDFNIIKTNYRERYVFAHRDHAAECDYYGINNAIVCLNKFESILEILYGIDGYFNKNITLFGATVNSIDKYRFLREIGFYGVITDFLCISN